MPEPLIQTNFDGRFRSDLFEVIFYQMDEDRFQLHTRREKDEAPHIFLSINGDIQNWSSLEELFGFVRWRGYLGDVIVRSWEKNDLATMDFISRYKNFKDSGSRAKAQTQNNKPTDYPPRPREG